MADERWAQISRIYNEAASLAAVDRAAFLRQACGSDEALQAEIESLLRDDTRVNALLEPKELAQNPYRATSRRLRDSLAARRRRDG